MMHIEIDVGATLHDQAVWVSGHRSSDSEPWTFDIVKLPANQRDDKVTIFSLPAEVLEKIGKAASVVQGIGK